MEVNLHVAFILKKQVTIQGTAFNSYTFCDLSSGNNFTLFTIENIKQYDNLKQLQITDIKCLLTIQKNGSLKLKPIKEV